MSEPSWNCPRCGAVGMAKVTHACFLTTSSGTPAPTPDPTLDQLLPTQNLTDRVVIRAIIDLREEVRGEFGVIHERITGVGLESAAAPAGCEPDRSVSVPPDDPTLLAALDWREQFLTAHRNFLDMSAERDEARRERDALQETCRRISEQCDELAESRVERNATILRLQQQLDATRLSFVALERVRDADVLPRGEHPLSVQVSDALLAPHGDDCRKRMYDPRSSPCTCGLTDALAAAGDSKPSEPAPSCTDMGKHAKHPGCPGRNKTIDDLYHDAQYGGC